MYKLIALDLDDTLLGKDAQVHPTDKAALAAARSAGVDVTFVTARSWRATRPYVEALSITAPVICMTGAVVYTPQGEPLHRCCIPLAEARRVAGRADRERWSCRLYFLDGRIYHSYRPDGYEPTLSAHAYPTNEYVGPVSPYLDGGEEPIQIALLGSRSVEGALALLPEFPDVVATTYDRYTNVSRTHLMHRDVNKGAALARYCAERGIAPEAVIAMGDGETDRSMIEWAGAGVAMGWAPEATRRAARLVTSADDPHPVATALQQLLGL
ncbi:MAG TPA: HAD family hydrolase [Symbiobacteriaceae bacterium]|jgi:Cof subfamily protein (haloacid dehalogenase superfamily)|nr:HAD family hydrolase [Symbiobacteriaceae bacterium]